MYRFRFCKIVYFQRKWCINAIILFIFVELIIENPPFQIIHTLLDRKIKGA